jgi:L-ascorbate metabolism protein UlaG (beta-lactamase superfamily)
VLITHGDNDHLNPNSLAFLPRSTRIVVPRLQEPPADYQVDIRGLLRCMGFDNIVEMAPWSALIIDEVTICACPFEGEDWGLNLPQLTYLIYSKAGAVYCSADSQMMPETFEKLKAEHPPIDVAFMGVSGCAEPHAVDARFGYGNFYRDWIPVHQHQEWVRHCMGPEEVCEMLKIFEPSQVFGYAVGGADYIDIAYSDVGSHQELKKCLQRRAVKSKAIDLEIGVPYSWTQE